MSWSVGATGKAPAVAKSLESQFKSMEHYPCPEPEETAKQFVRQAFAVLLAGHSRDNTAVKAYASGSQVYTTAGEPRDVPKQVSNSLSVTLETIEFLE